VDYLKNYVKIDSICASPNPTVIGDLYKFVLITEELYCKDVLSKKFFVYMDLPIVPVILSKTSLRGIAPKGSYINVKDFVSAEALANYLTFLNHHEGKY
jgi:hypothetical protein